MVELFGNYFKIDAFAFKASDDEVDRPGAIVAAACAAWPDDVTQTRVAFADRDARSVGDRRVPLIVALVDVLDGEMR